MGVDMKKLIKAKKYILFASIILTLILLGIFLIFGNSNDKVLFLILSVVLPFIIYGFIRLLFFVISKNAPLKIMTIFSYFFIFACVLGLILSVIPYFIMQFPNGYSPIMPCLFAAIIGVLDYNTKL